MLPLVTIAGYAIGRGGSKAREWYNKALMGQGHEPSQEGLDNLNAA
jgi:hypothetical protein